MKKALYARLAWMGMVKNKRLYLPYLLSCGGMVLMFYILVGLSGSPVLENMAGGGSSSVSENRLPASAARMLLAVVQRSRSSFPAAFISKKSI